MSQEKKRKQSIPKNLKDGVFRMLFNNRQRLLELYNALHGTAYGEEEELLIQTLDDTVFINIKNDIAFLLRNTLIVLIEHQSTINPNMPLRMLLYISQIYDKIIETKRVYSESLIELPTPEFYVFYNGKKEYPLYQELRLSKAFKIQGEETNLELVVHVININYEKGAELLNSCKTLQEYSFFIYQIRLLREEGYERDEAVRKAIQICKERDVLRDFLETHEQEVFGMLFRELTEEEAREIYKADGLEEGIKQGRNEARREIAENMLAQGMTLEQITAIMHLSDDEIAELESGQLP